MYEDQQKWERFRDVPSSHQRLQPDHGRSRPAGPQRQWIAVAVLALLVVAGLWLLFTNGADPPDDGVPLGAPSTVPSSASSED